MTYDVIIVGGGASGLVAAIEAAKKGKKVLILEKNDKLGKKIYATGNGKCNLGNTNVNEYCYHSQKKNFPYEVMKGFPSEKIVSYFEALGLLITEKNGYLYPASMQAASVVHVLEQKCKALGIFVLCSHVVKAVAKKDTLFVVKAYAQEENAGEKTIKGKNVILAAGGFTYPEFGTNGDGYFLAKDLGHQVVAPLPALVALKGKEAFFKWVAGVRVGARAKLLINDTCIKEETGELQFTDYGISGVMIFNLSSIAVRALEQRKKVCVSLDFFKENETEEVFAILKKIVKQCPYKTNEELLQGVLPAKLAFTIIKRADLLPEASVTLLKDKDLRKLTEYMKQFTVTITGAKDSKKAQVAQGGVSVSEVKIRSMESSLVKGLYVIGELLDVDGICGGYNLMWAFATGYLAGNHASLL